MSNNDVYSKRGIKFKFTAEPYGNENPIIDIVYDNQITGSRQILAENIEITSVDYDNPTVICVTPITKGGEQWMTINFKNDLYDSIEMKSDRNAILTGVDLDHCLDDSTSDIEGNYLTWVWNEINFDAKKIINENDTFNYIKISHAGDFKVKFNFEYIERYSLDDDLLRENITEEGLTYLPVPDFIISPDKKDNRLTIDGIESDEYRILDDSSAIEIYGLDIFAPEEFEFVALKNTICNIG